MNLTKLKLKQLIKEELEKVDELFKSKGEFGPMKEIYNSLRILADGLDDVNKRVNQLGGSSMQEVLRVRDPNLEARVTDIRNQVGDDSFIEELMYAIPDDALRRLVTKVAKEKQLTVKGVSYMEGIK